MRTKSISPGWPVLLTVIITLCGGPVAASERLCATVAELHAAFRTARPGDVFLMRDGTWADADIVFEGTGEPDRPIFLRAATPGQVVLTGRSRVRFSGPWLVVDGLRFEKCGSGSPTITDVVEFRTSTSRKSGYATNSRLTNCSFVDCSPPDRKTNTRYVSLFGHDNRVDHCYLAGKTNLGPSLVVWLDAGPVRHRIDHNHFGPRRELGTNGGETIRVGDSTTSQLNARCMVEANLFTACNGEVEIISNKSCENVYRHNTFVDCEGTLTLRHGHRNVVEGNFFFGHGKPKTGGIRIINEDQRVVNNYLADLTGEGPFAALCLMNGIPNSPLAGYDQVRRALVAFNTVVHCRESLVIGYQSAIRGEATLAPQDSTFAHNLVVGSAGPLVRIMTAPAGCTWRGNFFFGAEAGVRDELRSDAIDPRLARDREGRWRPLPDSPVVGAATDSYPEVIDDIDGQPRPATKDAGCDQLSAAPIVFRPLKEADVGPAWRRGASSRAGER
ncbi:MAG: polysaccharide lyase 6 family protein [Opitutaceae bacterium]|nr:polysaccharide lyase 6 family protein [Opitutaceae bacterium]